MEQPREKVYTIKEVAELSGVPVYKIRQWEKKVQLLRPKRHIKTNWRYYTQEHIEIVRKINYMLKYKKLRLDGINKELLKIERLGVPELNKESVKTLIDQMKIDIARAKHIMQTIIDDVKLIN